jgi:hypothetical protein
MLFRRVFKYDIVHLRSRGGNFADLDKFSFGGKEIAGRGILESIYT